MGDLDYQVANLRQVANAIEKHTCKSDNNMIHIVDEAKHRQRLTPNFFIGEYMCRDGSTTIMIDKRLAEGLQAMRNIIGKPIIITSAYRTPEHNKAVGGAQPSTTSLGSQHLYGKAADITVRGMSGDQLAQVARQVGFTGIGVAGTWCHVDVRDIPAEWRY